MYLNVFLSLCLCCALLPLSAASLQGQVVLKNASHSDKLVGTNPKDAVSQGHELKVVLQKVKHGKKMFHGSVQISIRHGNTVVSSFNMQTNDTGYSEHIIKVPRDWSGVYQVNVSAESGKKQWQSAHPFRVIAAEPASDVPEASALGLLAAMIIALSLCWRSLAVREAQPQH